MYDHPAKVLTAADAADGVCSVCCRPVLGGRQNPRHVGEAAARPVVPARADMQAVRRAAVVTEQVLAGLVWSPTLTDAARAQAIVDALYAAGLIAQRPRAVRSRRVRAA